MNAVALIAVTRKGVERACLLRRRLGSGEVFRPAHFGPPAHPWEHAFENPLSAHIADWFAAHDQLIFFLAAGAVTRLIAPCLDSKENDPGVLTMDEAGQFVIPLLSGHRGGANAFARTVAGCLGAMPVITTASDVIGGLSLDSLERQFGWLAEPKDRLKQAALALVNKEPVAIIQEIGSRGTWLGEMELPDNLTITDFAQSKMEAFSQVICISDRLVANYTDILWLRPKSLVLGVGCERGPSLQGLNEAVNLFLTTHGYARASIDTLASVSLKKDEQAFLELAQQEGWQTSFYAPEELQKVPGIETPSAVVAQCIGTPGVAEPAALLASASERLLVPKQIIRVPGCPQAMTFALARHAYYRQKNAPTSTVVFIGAGPGDPELLTRKGWHVLSRADVVVYAGSLVPEALLHLAPKNAQLHNSAFLTLEQVMTIMIHSARLGRRVVRLHSGDTSLYSAIQEQIAVLEKENIAFEIVPGISSFQALAAALKSEFTLPEKVQTVILTRGQGKTPMPRTERLTELARHKATLCIYLSARIADEVQSKLLTAYPPETPVAIAHRVSWPDQEIIVTRLDRLAATIRERNFQRTTLIAVGEAIGARQNRSQLYDENHGHVFRKRKRAKKDPAS